MTYGYCAVAVIPHDRTCSFVPRSRIDENDFKQKVKLVKSNSMFSHKRFKWAVVSPNHRTDEAYATMW